MIDEVINKTFHPPIDDRFRVFRIKVNEFLVFDIFKNLPMNYHKRDGKIFDVPRQIKEMGVILFNGNLKNVCYNKDPRQVFIGQKMKGDVMNIQEVHEDDCIVLHPPYMFVHPKKVIESVYTEGIIIDISMS